jgi:hypothetical protein
MKNMTNNTNGSLALRGVAAAILLACGAPAAFSQNADLEGSFDQPLNQRAKAGAGAGGGGAGSLSITTFSDGTNTYTVRTEGGKTTAEVNGKPVPAERVRERGGDIEILDEKGNVVHTFSRPWRQAMPRGGQVWGNRAAPLAPALPAVPAAPAFEPPPVMLGMLMNDAPDEEGVLVETVFEGLPAAKGGIKVGDVIVSLAGKAVTNSMDVRESLMKTKAGQKVEALVKRGGEETKLTITLEAYDQERMNAAREKAQPDGFAKFFPARGAEGGEGFGGNWNALGGKVDEGVRKAMEEAIAALKDKQALLGNEQRAQLQEKLEKALKEAEQARGMAMNRWRAAFDANEGGRVIINDGVGRVFTLPPAAPPAPMSPMSPAQSDQLNQRLDRLMDYFDRLNERLDRLEKSLEQGKQP